MKRILSTLAAVVTAGFALAVPVAAHANVPGGGGSAPITIYAQPFTAYGCVYAGPAHPSGSGLAYNCSGGVYVKYWDQRIWGTKCVTRSGGLWGWSYGSC
jgi:hypothetical protein